MLYWKRQDKYKRLLKEYFADYNSIDILTNAGKKEFFKEKYPASMESLNFFPARCIYEKRKHEINNEIIGDLLFSEDRDNFIIGEQMLYIILKDELNENNK